MKTPQEIRSEIDLIDDQITDLFLRRMVAAKEIAETKRASGTSILNVKREEEILTRLSSKVGEEFSTEIVNLYETLFSISRNYQERLLYTPTSAPNPASHLRIFLYGPPAAGKTTLGKRLGSALSLPFIDLDEEIEKKTALSISDFFSKNGEKVFRSIEAETLKNLPSFSAVIALGGGTLLNPDSRSFCENNGIVWTIESPSQTELNRRINISPSSRPLGDQSLKRKEHYKSFPHRITTFFDLPDSLVIIGKDLGSVSQLGDLTIADATAAGLHSDCFSPNHSLKLIPSGESRKKIATIKDIWETFLKHSIGRKSRIVSFGGGVTGDLVGFAAATWMRGIPWVNCPTTLLSMVDASTGGKTGFDLPQGKNLIGAFHSPSLVLIDAAHLTTLSTHDIASGKAEMIKHAIIKGLPLSCKSSIPSPEEIATNLSVKIDIVKDDPFETLNKRILLNCGHTIGHALEIATGFKLSHGECVAIGCIEEAKIAHSLGLAQRDFIEELIEAFQSAGLPTTLPRSQTIESLRPLMLSDKKHTHSTVTFALPCAHGSVKPIPIDLSKPLP